MSRKFAFLSSYLQRIVLTLTCVELLYLTKEFGTKFCYCICLYVCVALEVRCFLLEFIIFRTVYKVVISAGFIR